MILNKLLKSWFGKIADDSQKQEEVFKFLSDAKGLQFLITRIQGHTSLSPYFEDQLEHIAKVPGLVSKDDSQFTSDEEDDSMEDDSDFSQEILKFVGQKVGLRLTKKDSISTSLVLKKSDQELLQAAKVVTQMRKQTAIFNRSPTKEFGLLSMNKTRGKMMTMHQMQENDEETMQTLKSLTERNFGMSLQLIDCSKGESITEKLRSTIWNQSKIRDAVAARILLDPSKDLKNEFFLTFDLGSVVQLTELQISFNGYFDMYSQDGQCLKPQMVIVEGKKESMFVSSKYKSRTTDDTESTDGTKIAGEWQTPDTGDWV